jgi:signal transduction histidine kinase
MLDPDQIQQVILNLLVNAADAMAEEGGRLWVRTRACEGCAELEVEDTGIGIPEENLVRIFDPFFTTKDQRKGVGLGLSVSYGIVKAHHGELAVRNRQGRGTIFTVRLPLIQENSAGG